MRRRLKPSDILGFVVTCALLAYVTLAPNPDPGIKWMAAYLIGQIVGHYFGKADKKGLQ